VSLIHGKRKISLKEQFIRKEKKYMNIDEVIEWYRIADNDFDSAKLLNDAVRKHYEIICYHCSQSVEKYLKGYLIYNDLTPQKTHDLLFLINLCIKMDNDFEDIMVECGFLNRFANDIRYPHRYEVNENDVNHSIDAVNKIRDFKPISDLRNCIKDETLSS
jgi:HEPN domain-containing protein